MENQQNELERIVRKVEDLISCDFKKCEIRGDYWKCYMGNERKCPIYLQHLKNNARIDRPYRHHNIPFK